MNKYVEPPALVYQRDPKNWGQRVGPMWRVPLFLQQYGVDPSSVLERVGLPPDALSNPESRIPYVALIRLLKESTRLTGCDHFALLVASECQLADLGVMGQLTRHSATVGEALGTAAIYHQLNAQGGAVYLLKESDHLVLGCAVYHPEVEDAHLVHEVVMAYAACAIRELAGYDPDFMELEIPCHAPSNMAPYQRHFRCPIRFNTQRASLRLPLSLLHHPVPGADKEVRRQLQEQVEHGFALTFESKLYRSLSSLLMMGLPSASGDAVAQQLALHRRTFNRRLKAIGTTFQAVLDEVRFSVARQLLRDTQLPIEQIAATLSYSESSAFGRAFRRWSGLAPHDWRAAEQGQR